MRILRIGLQVASILALSTLLAVGFGSHNFTFADHDGCSVALLEGTYAYAAQAYTLIPPFTPPPGAPMQLGNFLPLAFAGAVTFDGRGNLQGADVVNLGGSGGIPRTIKGTYVVVDRKASRDACAFTTTNLDSLGNTFHTYNVLANNGESLMWVNTDPGYSLVFNSVRK